MAKTALKREVVVKKVDDGSHGHVCQHCSVKHRHVDTKCQYIGLAYFSCPACLAIHYHPTPGFEEAVAAVDPGDSFDEPAEEFND
jgi:hypothetical protein